MIRNVTMFLMWANIALAVILTGLCFFAGFKFFDVFVIGLNTFAAFICHNRIKRIDAAEAEFNNSTNFNKDNTGWGS